MSLGNRNQVTLTEHLCSLIVDELGGYSSVREWQLDHQRTTGLTITASALRHAFKKYGFSTPSTYCKAVTQPSPTQYGANEVSTVLVDEGGPYEMYFEDEYYELELDDVEKATILYSEEGANLSAKEVTIELIHTGVPEKAWRYFFKEIGQDKKQHPEAPHQANRDPLEVYREARLQREAIKRNQGRTSLVKELEKENERLKDKLGQIERALENTKLRPTSRRKVASNPLASINDHTLLLTLSDVHVGKKSTKFNKEILRERIDKICAIIQDMSLENVKAIEILFLGDLFEALLANMRPFMADELDLTGMDQYKAVVDIVRQVIDTVIDLRDNKDIPISVLFTAGNHDRLLADKKGSTERVLNHILALNVEAYYSQVERVMVAATPLVFSRMLNSNVCLIGLHGHTTHTKTYEKISNLVLHHGEASAGWFLVIQGHLHNFDMKTGINWRMVTLPSLVGPDQYSDDFIIKGAPAEFVSFRVYKDRFELLGPYPLA